MIVCACIYTLVGMNLIVLAASRGKCHVAPRLVEVYKPVWEFCTGCNKKICVFSEFLQKNYCNYSFF
jgi:hypothetical protein